MHIVFTKTPGLYPRYFYRGTAIEGNKEVVRYMTSREQFDSFIKAARQFWKVKENDCIYEGQLSSL